MIRKLLLAALVFFIIVINSPVSVLAKSNNIELIALTQATNTAEKSLNEDLDVATNTAKEEEKIQYELAYPGMLPDNPLYILKVIRDKIVRFLISDPLKEAEFNLLTSDKRLYAALLLIDKKKSELSLETLSKSNNYFHEAVFALSDVKNKKKDIAPLHTRMTTSFKKHMEIIEEQIIKKAPQNLVGDFKRELTRLETIEKSVDNLKPN